MPMDDGDWCERDGDVDTALAGYCIAYCGISSVLHRLSLHSRLSHPSSTPPLCSSRLAVTSHLVARLRLSTHRQITCCLSASSPYIRQLALAHRHFRRPFSRRRGHHRHPQMHGALSRRRHRQWPLFPLMQLSSSNTSACAPATCSLLRHLRLTSASLPSLAPPFSSPPLSAPRPLPASSNARRTLPAAASPTATVPSCTALALQHVRLCHRIVIFAAQPSSILAQLSSYLGER